MDMKASLDEERWYAVLTRSRQEKTSASMLDYLAVTNFLPLLEQERRWSDRTQRISIPLFSGYLFVKIARTSKTLLQVLKVPGIVDFVRTRTGPMPIPDGEIEGVRSVLFHRLSCRPHPFLKTGDRVRVVRGPLIGVGGVLIRTGSESRLAISVEMIRRSIVVDVSESDVEPVYRFHGREQAVDPSISLF